MFNTSSAKGNEYGSFFVVAFSYLKSIHIFILPFFFGTMGDNHVASFTYSMNLAANNLSISYLTTVT
jgi:hypothetical protein